MIDDKSEPGAWAAALQAREDTANKPTTTDHAEAAAVMLEKVAAQLRAGRPPEDMGSDVILIGRMMARKT